MESKDQSEILRQAGFVSKLAYAFACFLLMGSTMFVHSVVAASIHYLKTGYFPNPPTISSLIITILFLAVSTGLFVWSRRLSRAAGEERPILSKRFVIGYTIFFVLAGLLYYI